MNVCMYTCMLVCMYLCIHVCICTYKYACNYVFMYTCIHICVFWVHIDRAQTVHRAVYWWISLLAVPGLLQGVPPVWWPRGDGSAQAVQRAARQRAAGVSGAGLHHQGHRPAAQRQQRQSMGTAIWAHIPTQGHTGAQTHTPINTATLTHSI